MLLLIALCLTFFQPDALIYDFNKETGIDGWAIVDDVVMGGRSNGTMTLNTDGNAVFSGVVSLENNGGFSSVRYPFAERSMAPFSMFVLRVKGDGKAYQFRVKSDRYDRHSYVYTFDTQETWEMIEIPMNGMYPSFRGQRLNISNYPGQQAEEIAILIGNKRPESFHLEVDWIGLRK